MVKRADVMTFVRNFMNTHLDAGDEVWVALYRLFLDYAIGVPRITDANRLGSGIWRTRAEIVQTLLAEKMGVGTKDVEGKIDRLMVDFYPPNTQRQNPIGIAFACAAVYLIERFSLNPSHYRWLMESKIGVDVFPNLSGFRRKSVDIVTWKMGEIEPYHVISSKWGFRHDRIRDPQEESVVYKEQVDALGFYVITNEFDVARLRQLIKYPTIDGVFHVNRNLIEQVYGTMPADIVELKDITELASLFP